MFVTVMASDGADVADVVLLPEGVTVKVYESPLVRPVTVQLCVPVGGVAVFATTQDEFAGTPYGDTCVPVD